MMKVIISLSGIVVAAVLLNSCTTPPPPQGQVIVVHPNGKSEVLQWQGNIPNYSSAPSR